MIALQAVYDQGRIFFPFNAPEHEGPLQVLVIFPGEMDPASNGLPTTGCSGLCLCGGIPDDPTNFGQLEPPFNH